MRVKFIEFGLAAAVAITCLVGTMDQLAASGVQYTYDDLNRLTRVEHDDGSVLEYSYDGTGNRISEDCYDPQATLRKSLDFTYDPYNRLKRIVTPEGDYTEYTYDERGNRTAVRDYQDSDDKLCLRRVEPA